MADFKAIYKVTYLKECSICKDWEIDQSNRIEGPEGELHIYGQVNFLKNAEGIL